MLAKTHILGGAAAVSAYLFVAQPETIQSLPLACAAVGLGLVGGLVPDVDHPKSLISKVLGPVRIPVSLVASHRGAFHSPALYLVLWSLGILKFSEPALVLWWNLFFLGIASHLFLDFLTPGGIPLLAPFDRKRRHIARVRTGSKGESFVRGIFSVLSGILFFAACSRCFPL